MGKKSFLILTRRSRCRLAIKESGIVYRLQRFFFFFLLRSKSTFYAYVLSRLAHVLEIPVSALDRLVGCSSGCEGLVCLRVFRTTRNV